MHDQPQISGPKKLLFGVFFFTLILFLIELLLSFAGLEKYDKEFMPKSSYPLFISGKGEMSEHYITNPHFAKFVNYQSFRKKKPKGTIRIFLVGGSAVYGSPYNNEKFAFSGYLRRALNSIDPGKFEVINVAGMSFGSHRVLDVLKDVVNFEPDLVIVYSGNNEYVEHNVLPAGSKENGYFSKIEGLLSQTNIYRSVRKALFTISPGTFTRELKNDITDLRASGPVRGHLGRSSENDRQVLANYQNNIKAMKELFLANKVKGIFCTVPVNLTGWFPTFSEPNFTDQLQVQKWQELMALLEKAASKRDTHEMEKLLSKTLEISPDNAVMNFHYALALGDLKQHQESYQRFVKAKDLDPRPIRALSTFNDVLRAEIVAGKNLYLVDLEKDLDNFVLQGDVAQLFIDYCHYNEKGHKYIATLLFLSIKKVFHLNIETADIDNHIQQDDIVDKLDDRAKAYVHLFQAMTLFNNMLYEAAEQAYLNSLQFHVIPAAYTNLALISDIKGDHERSKKMRKKSLELDPTIRESWIELGDIYLKENNLEEAQKHYLQAIELNSFSPHAYQGLGFIAMKRKDYMKAISLYNEALKLGKDNVSLRMDLAQAYREIGKKDKAIENWYKALGFRPDDKNIKELIEQNSDAP